LFPIRIRPEARLNRDEIVALLTEKGIGSSVHYRPLHLMSYWRRERCDDGMGFPAAERYFAGAVTLPVYPAMRDVDAEEVVAVLRKALG
jgi:dTDP-4-amino-4,6-dideoxygalactose transaminase